MRSTHIRRHINAPHDLVYRTLLNANAIARWKVTDGMTYQIHAFDAREGGFLRVSLTHDAPTVTITLEDSDDGTDLAAVHDDLPPGVSLLDNEIGWRMALAKLAALLFIVEHVSRVLCEQPAFLSLRNSVPK